MLFRSDGKKLAGILSEKCEAGVVVGIGINIFQTQDELPIANAVSLSMFGTVNRDDLLIEILNELGRSLSDIEQQKTLYRENCATIGNIVRATLPDGEMIEDLALGISNDGSLLLNSREIRVGDIVHLRYAGE